MLYITLSGRNIRRVLVFVAAAALLTAVFCAWALCSMDANQSTPSASDVSQTDCDRPPSFTVVTPADAKPADESASAEQPADAAVPAHVSLYPFTIDRSICLPVQNACISSEFGFRDHPINGKYTFHSGLDLAAPEGTDICAMLDGTVITAGYASDYGNYVILNHGDFQTLYAHCLKLCVAEGEEVTAGQKIAEVGSTGRATGSHLHVEFRCNGQRYDPAAVLGDSYR